MTAKKSLAIVLIVVTFPVLILFWIGWAISWAMDELSEGREP